MATPAVAPVSASTTAVLARVHAVAKSVIDMRKAYTITTGAPGFADQRAGPSRIIAIPSAAL